MVPQSTDLREEILRELLPICCASRCHEDVLGSSLQVLLEWDEVACRGFFPIVSHVPAGQG